MKQVLPLIFAILCSLALNAQPIYVDADATGTNDGTTWENAYSNLSEAIDAAQSGDNLWVAAGIYYPTHQPNYEVGSANARFNHFTLKNGVSIFGGFAGDESLLDQRDLTAYKTVISGDIDQNDNVGENGYVTGYADVVGENSLKLFYFPTGSTIDTTAVLDGFVLAGAVADNDVFPYMGGAAMLCQGASPKVVNCEFYGHYAQSSGGAIWVKESQIIINNCTFSGNHADWDAGAVCFNTTDANLIACTFTNNTAKYGGAVNIVFGENISLIEDCYFSGNESSQQGGAIASFNAKAIIKNTVVVNNEAAIWGGGIAAQAMGSNNSFDIDIINCTINSNKANTWGGGIGAQAIDNASQSLLEVVNSKIQGNTSLKFGGGIGAEVNSNVDIYNCLISGNKADNGSGDTYTGAAVALVDGASGNVYNTTITANYNNNPSTPCAVVSHGSGSELNFYNSIVHWNNADHVADEWLESSSGVIKFYNTCSFGVSGNGNTTDNPMFLTDPNSISKPSTDGDFRLWGNSPVNNKGVNSYLPKDKWDLDNDGNVDETISVDLNGNARVFAGVSDLGCFEQQFTNASGYGLTLNGNDGYVELDEIAQNTNITNKMTFECWVYINSDKTDDVRIFAVNTSSGGNRALLSYNRESGFYYYVPGVGTMGSKLSIENQWVHVALALDKDVANGSSLYVNGKLTNSFTYTDILFASNDLVSLGQEYDNGTKGDFMKGSIDEVRIWNDIRSQEEILNNINSAASGNEDNLQLYYSFDQVTSGDIEDNAGSVNGKVYGGAGIFESDAILTPILKGASNVGFDNFSISWEAVPNASEYYVDVATDEAFNNIVKYNLPTSGNTELDIAGLSRGSVYFYKVKVKVDDDSWGSNYSKIATKLTPPGNALKLNGDDANVNIGRVAYENWDVLTLEAWVKVGAQDAGIWGRILGNFDFIDVKGFNLVLYADDGYPMFEFIDAGGVQRQVIGTSDVTDNGWHHLAAVFTGTELFMYVDGVLEKTTGPISATSITASIQDLVIGDASNQYINGTVDEVRIWRKARTQSEIVADKNKTLVGDEEGLILYYDFDLQSGSQVIDVTSRYDGVINGDVERVKSDIFVDDFVASASTFTTTGFKIDWNAVASTYVVEVATDADFTNIVETSVSISATSYNVTGLEQGTKHYFRVTTNEGEVSPFDYATTLLEVPGNALWLDGKDDYVEVNQVAAQGNKTSATMECWAYVDPTETFGRFLAINTSSGGNKYLLSYQANEGYCLYLENGATKTTIASYDFRRGQWVHLAVAMNGTATTSFYVNGELVGSTSGGSDPLFSGNQISIGQEFDGVRTGDFLKGAIDEVRFWDDIRTETEIKANMHKILTGNESNLLAYYNFDQTNGSTVFEKVKGLNGNINSSPIWQQSEAIITPVISSISNITPNSITMNWNAVDGADDYRVEVATDIDFNTIVHTETSTSNATTYKITGLEENTNYFARIASHNLRWSGWSLTEKVATLLLPPGNALSFDGVDGMVDIGQVMAANWNEITLEAWVKIPDEQNPDSWGRIVSNYSASGGFGINLTKDFGNNKVNHIRFEFMSPSEGQKAIDSKIEVDDNVWHHIAAVYDKQKMYLYIDGKLDYEEDVTDNLEIKKAIADCGFGNQWTGAHWHPMKGTLDEVRIWNVARTPAKLNEFAHKTLDGDETGLIAYYNVDKAEGTTFKDEAGNFDGTMSGGVTWANSQALITPFTLPATAVTNNVFTANWDAIPNASKYYLRVATDKLLTQPIEGFDSVNVGNVTSHNVLGLLENTNYYYGIMSYTDRLSAWSVGQHVKTSGGSVGELAINLEEDNNSIDLSNYIAKVAGKNTGAIAGWFKTSETGTLFSLTDGGTNYAYIKVGDVNSTYSDESFSYWIRKDNDLKMWMMVRKGEDFFTDNKWHHFAVITGDGNNRILIDGIEQELEFNTGNSQTQVFSDVTAPTSLYLGNNFNGAIDEIAIYRNPLTNAEVVERAHKKLTGAETGLVAFYTFDNSNAADSSGMGRNATIVGTVSYESAKLLTTPFLNEVDPGVTLANLSWTAIDGATEYIIDVATDKFFQNKIVSSTSITTSTSTVNNLDKNTKYYYRVKAKVNSVWSEFSAVGVFNTLPGKALVLDGDGDYAKIANPVTEDFTIELWMYPEPVEYTTGTYSFTSGDGLVSGEVGGVVNDFGLAYKNNRIVFGVGDDVNNRDWSIVSDSCIFNNAWNHIAATREMATGIIKLFVNGRLVAEQTTTSLEPLTVPTILTVGAHYDNATAWDKFKGEIDELRIWNKACTQDEIRANMNLSEPQGANEHYISHYTFDEIYDGTTIKDLAKQNDATLVGGANIKNSEGVIVPITLEADNATLGSFDMHINNIASAASFEIEVAYDATFVPPLAIHENIGRNLDYTVNGLCPGVKYYFRTRAIYNDNTISSWSTPDTVRTVDQNAEIQNLQASEGAYSQNLKLTWECSNDYLVTDFEIQRRITGEGAFEYLATVENNADFYIYTDSTAAPGTYYEYTIQGLSYCYGNDTKVDTSNIGFNIPTLELSKEINDETQEAYIRLDYEFHPDFLRNVEIVRINTENGTSQTFSEVKDSLIYRDGSVELCTPYTYQLIAKTFDYGDVKSHTKDFTLEEDIFDAIDTLDASKGYYDNKIVLNWKSYKQNIIDEYQISRRKFENNADWQVVKVIERGSTQVWIDEDATAGEYYEYLIVGYGTCGDIVLTTDSATSVGFRQPEGTIAGQISYEGGNPVFDVKLTVGYDDGSKMGNCLYFDGSDELTINPVNTFDFTKGKTLEMWISFEPFDNGFVLYNNNGLVVDYFNSGELSAMSGLAIVNYDIKTDTKNVWTDSTWNHLAITANADSIIMLVNGVRVAKNENTTSLAFDTTQVATGFMGYIEELRVWNSMKADSVIDRYKGLMIGRDEDNLVCNLRFDEKRGYYAFDHSRSDDEPNKSHAIIDGAAWSAALPSLATLSLGAKTEPNGSYLAKGIWFKGSGDSYSITPSYGVHEFDPGSRSMLVSENSLVYSNQDFTDISAFKVTGNVKYYGANFPVQDVMLAIDGQMCVNAEGQPITTDDDGNFEIEVPIGEHFISVQKIQHTFSAGFFPPKDVDGNVTHHLFDNPVSGIQFIDSTFITVAGRIVGGTVEGDKEIGFNKSKNNLGVADFTVEAAKGYPIQGANNTLTVTTDGTSGEYEVKLFPEVYNFVIDATHNVGNAVYNFASIDDLSVLNLADPLLENTATDTVTIEEITGSDTTVYDSVYEYKYHVKRNWVYRSVPSIEVTRNDGASYFSDSILTTLDANNDSIQFTLINADGSNRLDYPAFTKGGFYNTLINVFEEYENIDNNLVDRVPVQDGKVTVINGLATYPAPVDFPIENGKVAYEFIGGFPNPTLDNTNPELSYTKAFEVHSYTGDGGSMHSVWPAPNNPYRGYVFGGIPTGQNFITQGPDQVDFILRDPPGSNSSATFEEGFTVSSSTSTSWENSSTASGSVAVDLGWSVTTFVGFGAGAIFNNELIAETEVGVSTSSTYSGGRSTEVTTTFTKSYSTSDDPAYVGAMGDLFFGHSTNITYGVSNCINVLPVGTGEEDLGTDVDGFTVGLSKGLNLGLQFGTSFIYTQNHIENYLIPDLEMFYEKLLSEGDTDSANYYLQQADLWRKTLAENEFQKYWAIKYKNSYPENENLSFDAGAIYEQSMETEITKTQTSAFEFSVEKSISEELGFEALGMGTTIKLGYDKGKSESKERESSETTNTTIAFTLNDGDQGDYFSVDVLKDPFGNGPVFSTLGGQSACPYEGGNTVKYADYLDKWWAPTDFNNEFQLNYPTMKIEVPKISAVNSIVAGVPDNEPAVFTLKLSNQSEVNADNWFTLKLDAASNPYGAKLKMDGAAIVNGVSILVPGGTTLTKTLELEKGQDAVNDYENINLILHSQCQFDPTDDVDDIADTVTISANFVPTCSDVAVLNPSDNWLMNAEANDLMPVKVGGYNINHGTFERVAFQYKAEAAASWNTLAMFYNDTTDYAVYAGEKYKIDGSDVIFYNWDMSVLQDKSYQIRAVSICTDGSTTESPAHTGILDGVKPQVFGSPSPADGILEPNDEIMITFNETIEEGAVTYYNIDVQGVLNGAEINHGTSVALDGDADYLETPSGINLENRSYSIEFWLKKEVDAAGVVFSQGVSTDGLFEIAFTADSIQVVKGAQMVKALNSFNDANWHHYAVTYDAALNMLSIYIDDKLAKEQSFTALTENGKVLIGQSALGANNLAANIHDVRIWRKALSFSNIIAQMNASLVGNEFGLLANWPMNEAEGTLLLDKVHSRNATLTGGWLLEPASIAYELNGTDQALSIETGSIPIGQEMDMTIEMWFKAATPNSNATLFSNGNKSIETYNNSKTLNINMTTAGALEVVSGSEVLTSSKTYSDDLWHHVAYVINRRGYATLYVDAEKVASATASGFGSMQSASAYVGALGYIDNSLAHQTSQFFNGSIDEVRIWNVARSQKQIELYKNNRLSGSEIGLKAYFPFEAYEEVMGVMLSTETLADQSIDPFSATGANHCGNANAIGELAYSEKAPNIRRERAVAKVNFDYVINNDKIIITPTDELALIEKCILEITVQNIQDKHANKMASPATWTAYIKKNQVVWADNMFNFEKELSESLRFTTTIINEGGTQQNFSISNLPNWLSVSPEMGSLDPDSELEVEFTVNDGLNIGNYSEDIYLSSNSGYNERLSLDLRVYKQAPEWTVDETAYQSSMNVIAQLSIKDVISNDKYDMIGVFAGDLCRGVCNLEYKANYDAYFAFLVIYGNESGEELSYRVWDASEGKIYSDVAPTYNFEPNKFYGTVATPILFNAGSKLDNTIELNKGWNWLSFNLEMSEPTVKTAFDGLTLSAGDIVKHAELFTAFDASTSSWIGSLNKLELGKLYRANVQQGGKLLYMGAEADVADYPITLINGWNRIGYIPSENMTVNEALAGFEPQVNDVVKSQYQFAIYDGYEWIGSMNYMEAGKGYMYQSYNNDTVEFTYPNASEMNQKSALVQLNPNASTYGINVGNYEYVMNVTAKVLGTDIPESAKLAAYVNGELRGIASLANFESYSNYAFVSVYGSAHELDADISFTLLLSNTEIPLTGSSMFAGNGGEGDLYQPLELNAGMLNVNSSLADGLSAFPNPFNKELTVQYNLLSNTDVKVEVYNLLGEKVITLASKVQTAGTHTLVWDGNSDKGAKVEQGVYFVHLTIGENINVMRIVKE